MLRVDRTAKTFTRLKGTTMTEAAIREVDDLQAWICNSPNEFFEEMDQKLFLMGKEVEPSDTVADRIDLLALDIEGNAVVVELKRGSNKLQLYQAVSYAGMIAKWSPADFLDLLTQEQTEKLREFLEFDFESINRKQRIVLVAEAYDYSLLVGAEWLSEQHGVDVLCCRVSIAVDSETDAEYLACTNVFPAPEIAEQSISRRRRTAQTAVKWSSWENALEKVENRAVVEFFKGQLESERDEYLPNRQLWYRVHGRRCWSVEAKPKHAYVWQEKRFKDDVAFWKDRLSAPDTVGPVKSGKALRFKLITQRDFQRFHEISASAPEKLGWELSTDDSEQKRDEASE